MPRRSYSKEDLQAAVQVSDSYAGVLRYLGVRQAGGTQAHIKRRIADFQIEISHFTGKAHNKGIKNPRRQGWAEILVVRPDGSFKEKTYRLRRALLESGRQVTCVRCDVGVEWNGCPIVLEIDHINEDFLDNRRENLQFLCPNCHSQKTAEARLRIPTAEESRLERE